MKRWIFASFGFVLSLWVATGYVMYDLEDKGQYGDMFGSVNALFSGLAFAGLVIAILQQQKELRLTKDELRRTATATEAQVNHFAIQKKREDIYRLISRVTERINRTYNGNNLPGGLSFHRLMLGPKNVDDDEDFKKFCDEAEDKNTKTYAIVRYLERDLTELMGLLKEYERVSLSDGEATPFLGFFCREYGELVEALGFYSLLDRKLFYFYHVGAVDKDSVTS